MKDIKLPEFQQYQLAFTQRLRNPVDAPLPEGVDSARMGVYEALIFNNLMESVSQCFPVASTVLGTDAWQNIIRRYFLHYASNTPIFREIPKTFVDFIASADHTDLELPDYLASLCHYEWIELALSTQKIDSDPAHLQAIETAEQLLQHPLVFISPKQLLHYEYPVHIISPERIPDAKEAAYLLVYRDAEDEIAFIALNATTFQLFKRLSEDNVSAEIALEELNETLQQPIETLMGFALNFLHDFYQKGVIKGYTTNSA